MAASGIYVLAALAVVMVLAIVVGAFLTDCKLWRIKKSRFTPRFDHEVVFLKPEKNTGGGRPAHEYVLTLDMAKHLAMIEEVPYQN